MARRSVQHGGAELVEQPYGLRVAALLEQDRSAGPVGVRWAGAMHEQWLVDPRAGVGELRPAGGAPPAAGIVARERPAAVDMPEDDPLGVDAEPMDDPPERGDACASRLRSQQ